MNSPFLSVPSPNFAAMFLRISFAQGDLSCCQGTLNAESSFFFFHKCLYYITYYCSIHSNSNYSVDDKVGNQACPPDPWQHNYSKMYLGLPWWRSGWESACQCRAHGFEPWSGRIPHAAERLGPWATIAEPARLEPVLHNKRGRDGEGAAHRDEEWPPFAAAREGPRTEMKTQHSHK